MSAYCCIELDLLLTLNHDARNHEFKKKIFVCLLTTQPLYLGSGTVEHGAHGIRTLAIGRTKYSDWLFLQLALSSFSWLSLACLLDNKASSAEVSQARDKLNGNNSQNNTISVSTKLVLTMNLLWIWRFKAVACSGWDFCTITEVDK